MCYRSDNNEYHGTLSANTELTRGTCCFDPNSFEELSKTGISVKCLEKVALIVGISAISLKVAVFKIF